MTADLLTNLFSTVEICNAQNMKYFSMSYSSEYIEHKYARLYFDATVVVYNNFSKVT